MWLCWQFCRRVYYLISSIIILAVASSVCPLSFNHFQAVGSPVFLANSGDNRIHNRTHTYDKQERIPTNQILLFGRRRWLGEPQRKMNLRWKMMLTIFGSDSRHSEQLLKCWRRKKAAEKSRMVSSDCYWAALIAWGWGEHLSQPHTHSLGYCRRRTNA